MDLLARAAPRDLAARRRLPAGPPIATLGRYELVGEVPAALGRCFVGLVPGPWPAPVFVRRMPRAAIGAETIAELRRRALAIVSGLEAILELDVRDDELVIVSELVDGVGLDQAGALPWPVALAACGDLVATHAAIAAAGITLPAIRPSRIRFSTRGSLVLVASAPEVSEPRLLDALVAVLGAAVEGDAERALIARFAGDPDPAAVAVLGDALATRCPGAAALPALLAGQRDVELDRDVIHAWWDRVVPPRA